MAVARNAYAKLQNDNQLDNSSPDQLALLFFKHCDPRIRAEVAKHLNDKDMRRLEAVCRDFHGPFVKLTCKQEGERIGLKAARAVMIPGNMALNAQKVPYAGKVIGLPGLFVGLGFLAVSVPTFAGGFFVGSAKAKIQKLIKHENSNIRPFEGEQIVFKPQP